MEALNDGAAKLAGAELGVESFGIQVFDFPAGFSDYPEHDHAESGQAEVYVVLAIKLLEARRRLRRGPNSFTWS